MAVSGDGGRTLVLSSEIQRRIRKRIYDMEKEEKKMKSIDYVKRYGSRILSGDMDAAMEAAVEMANLLLSEANSEWSCCRNQSEKLANALFQKYNRKGNTIAELFKREYGRDILNPNWFKACVEITNENKEQKSAQHS